MQWSSWIGDPILGDAQVPELSTQTCLQQDNGHGDGTLPT